MHFSNRFYPLFILPALLSCAAKAPSKEAPSSTEQTLRESPSPDPRQSFDQKGDVLSYFYAVYPKGTGKPAEDLTFEEKDLRNGYLKVSGAMEGYFIYALFRGPRADWLIEQGSECGPACDQHFKAYKFVSGRLVATEKLERLYPKRKVDKHFADMTAKLPRGHTGEALQSWLRLPTVGTSIDLLILEQTPGHTSGSAGVFQVGRLDWNGVGFVFVPMSPTKPSTLPITSVR